MEEVHYYNTKVKWTEGRKGELSSSSFPQVTVATPPEFPQGVPNVWSPEHLFVASINICLMTTFLAIADNSKLEYNSFECEGTGKMERVNGKFMISEVELKPKLIIKHEKDLERAERIIDKSENACLISRSVKSTIKLTTDISVAS